MHTQLLVPGHSHEIGGGLEDLLEEVGDGGVAEGALVVLDDPLQHLEGHAAMTTPIQFAQWLQRTVW